MTVTLSKIAELVGVSVNTVSRALRDKEDIGAETKKRVREVAELLGYVPNSMARSLVLKETRIIGVAVTDSANPVRNEQLTALRSELETYGYHILIKSMDYDSDEQVKQLNELVSRQIDGLIVGTFFGTLGEIPIVEHLQKIIRRGIPIIVFGGVHSRSVSTVCMDYFNGGVIITEHLIKLGYKRITCFSVEPSGRTASIRGKGYIRGMERAGLSEFIEFFSQEPASLSGGRRDIHRYLKTHNTLPDAIIAHNDLQAIGIIRGLKEAGYRVPEDVAVVGFDNIEMDEYVEPPLTTIGWDSIEVARNITELLLDNIKNKPEYRPLQRILQPKLFVRRSCGAQDM